MILIPWRINKQQLKKKTNINQEKQLRTAIKVKDLSSFALFYEQINVGIFKLIFIHIHRQI